MFCVNASVTLYNNIFFDIENDVYDLFEMNITHIVHSNRYFERVSHKRVVNRGLKEL